MESSRREDKLLGDNKIVVESFRAWKVVVDNCGQSLWWGV